VRTVETHRAHLMKKLNVHSLVELLRFAARNGLICE
jgi:DNA-binding NarL/FixJ family response regulator